MRFWTLVIVSLLLAPSVGFSATPVCNSYPGWRNQTNPATDAGGYANGAYPEASSSTSFSTIVNGNPGSILTIHGRYPYTRFASLEIYIGDQVLDLIIDIDLQPDPGTNNPFISGTEHGTFTAYVVFGPPPPAPAPNTLYAGSLTSVKLEYRTYYANDPNDPSAGSTDPVTPELTLDGTPLPNCPVQPYLPPASTPWLRLDLGNWIGTPPAPEEQLPATNPAKWSIQNGTDAHYYPNGVNFYMVTTLSRQFLYPATSFNLFVVRFKAPTFPNTRAGELPHVARQVRFWSLCTDDPLTTNVNRCLPDAAADLDAYGYATFVISDPGGKPSDAALQAFHANWLPWGALNLPTDVVYDPSRQPWGIGSPVHYYNAILYRQTMAAATFTQSLAAVRVLPRSHWKAAMGPYWPVSGYCSTAGFEANGAKCLRQP